MEYEIINITAKSNLGFKPNLNKLAMNLPHSEYEPERFSGLIYRTTKPKATFLIFSSGKFIVMGKNEGEIEKSIERLKKTLKNDYKPEKEEIEKNL